MVAAVDGENGWRHDGTRARHEVDDTLDQTDEFPAEELPPEADELPRDADLDERDLGDLPD